MFTITTTIGRSSVTAVASSWRGHLEAAVAVDADDGRVRARGLRADGGRQAVAHRAEPARGDEAARAVAEQVLHRPHLVLADAGRPDHVVAPARLRLQLLEDALRLEQVAVCRSGAGTPRASSSSWASHGCGLGANALVAQRLERVRELGEDLPSAGPTTGMSACRSFPISAASTSRWTTVAPGANAESLPVTRSSKRAPTATSRSHLFIAQFDHFGAVHAGPAEVQLVRLRERALRHQRRDRPGAATARPAGAARRTPRR